MVFSRVNGKHALLSRFARLSSIQVSVQEKPCSETRYISYQMPGERSRLCRAEVKRGEHPRGPLQRETSEFAVKKRHGRLGCFDLRTCFTRTKAANARRKLVFTGCRPPPGVVGGTEQHVQFSDSFPAVVTTSFFFFEHCLPVWPFGCATCGFRLPSPTSKNRRASHIHLCNDRCPSRYKNSHITRAPTGTLSVGRALSGDHHTTRSGRLLVFVGSPSHSVSPKRRERDGPETRVWAARLAKVSTG